MARKAAEPVAGLIMNAKTLRALAFQWLRYEHGCYMVCMERSPFSSRIVPDVLGLNKTRHLIEVEIKVGFIDFDKDMKKKHRQRLMDELSRYRPRAHNQIWYLVPPMLVNHVMANVPEYAGVLTPNAGDIDSYTGFPKLSVVKKALKLHDTRLSIKHCVVMARDMSGTMASLVRDDVKNTVKKKKLEEHIVALGGELPKRKRKSKKTTATKTTKAKSAKVKSKKITTDTVKKKKKRN